MNKIQPAEPQKTYNWEQITYENEQVYIDGDHYGTEKEFYEDIETGKIKMVIAQELQEV